MASKTHATRPNKTKKEKMIQVAGVSSQVKVRGTSRWKMTSNSHEHSPVAPPAVKGTHNEIPGQSELTHEPLMALESSRVQ